MIRASLGFIFSTDGSQVLLLEKNRPSYLAGKWNGIGGKCDPGEKFVTCMARECREETGLVIAPKDWKKAGRFTWGEWNAHIFATIYPGALEDAQSLTDEPVTWHPAQQLPAITIPNVQWLVPMCWDTLSNPLQFQTFIRYR